MLDITLSNLSNLIENSNLFKFFNHLVLRLNAVGVFAAMPLCLKNEFGDLPSSPKFKYRLLSQKL